MLRGPKVRSCFGDNIWIGEAPKFVPYFNALEEIFHAYGMPILCARSPQVAFSKCLFARDDGIACKIKLVLIRYENEL